MTDKTTTIAVVVVTFNRKVLLIECLDALLAQTRTMDKIYLIDNASSDGTQALLEEHNLLNNPLIDYRLMTENLGGAGGFYEGIKAAHEDGYDWIWVMDDDAEACIDAAEKLEPYFNKPGVIAVCPILTDINNNIEFKQPHRGWFNPFGHINIARPIQPSDLVGKDVLIINHCSFVGLCFSTEAINRIGLPKKEFFIHYDDSEYCSRLNTIGQILLIKNCSIKHKEGAKNSPREYRYLFGRWRARECIIYDKLWIHFFMYRNYIWLITRNDISNKKIIMIILNHIKKLIFILLYEDNKLSRIKFWNASLYDGFNNIFDNDKPKRILKKKN